MPVPGFHAERAFGAADRPYRTVTRADLGAAGGAVTPAQMFFSRRRLPPGLCAKACWLCRDPERDQGMCGVCSRCFDDL
jgi:hypothetical protein